MHRRYRLCMLVPEGQSTMVRTAPDVGRVGLFVAEGQTQIIGGYLLTAVQGET